MIERKFYEAIIAWNKKKNFSTFVQMYRDGFDSTAFCGFRVWRIIRNTFIGRYKDLETKVNKGEVVVKG
jgi:hypothetical protein